MDWDIPIGRLVVLQEELEAEPIVIGTPVHPWVARCIRIHPWIGFMGAWCLLGEACLASAAMSHRADWLAYKLFQGLIWTGGGVVANLVVAGSVQKICAFLHVHSRETQNLFSRTCQATCCCLTWCHE